jgi:signal transduction histidine kinase
MKALRLLMCEDSADDAALLLREMGRGGYAPSYRRVETMADMRAALEAETWDLVVSDYTMPSFTALDGLRIMREVGAEIPFIIVSGTIGDESAVAALKAGASDFIVKQNLARLVPAIERELRDAEVRRERYDALRALRQAVRARDEFLSIASHELKTPLTSMQIQVQSLERMARDRAELTIADEKVQAKIRMVIRQVKRLAALVNALLDVTRITSGRLELVREAVSLNDLVNEVVGRLDAGPDDETQIRVTGAEPVTGWWDRMRLEAVVTNLLSNALKYGEGKPIDVSVGQTADYAEVTVRDHGVGIPQSEQARIFERFERAMPEHHHGGLGLGLWIARQIVDAHGGRITVESREGEGSTFVVELPFHTVGG